MKSVETAVFEFVGLKAENNEIIDSAKFFPTPDSEMDSEESEGIWVGNASGSFAVNPAGKVQIIDAALPLSIRVFIRDRDTANRQDESERCAELTAEIVSWFLDNPSLDVCGRASMLGFDNGKDNIDGVEYVGTNLYLAVNRKSNISDSELIQRARRSLGL